MQFIPTLGIYLLGGWIFLLSQWAIPLLTLFFIPRDVRRRLLDRTNFSRKQKIILIIGKLFGVILMVITIFSPLSHNPIEFFAGLSIYLLAIIGLIIALINYIQTPLNEPVTKGIYRISRNPQNFMQAVGFLGLCFMIGSYFAIILLVMAKIFGHIIVLAEEEACLKQYGQAYQDYMQKIPRYFLFF